MWRLTYSALAVCLAAAPTLPAQTLLVHVEGLRSGEGSIRCGFYDSPAQWQTKKSNFQRHGTKARLRGGCVTYTFTDVPAGRWAMAIVDDENDSGGMDWGMLLPREGFGFSDYELRGLTRPEWEDFDFELREGHVTEVRVRVRYL